MLHISPSKMVLLSIATVALFFSHVSAAADNVIGPAGFLWPTQRNWQARYQQQGPCGTNMSVSSDRTPFPISGGKNFSYTRRQCGRNACQGRIWKQLDPTSQDEFLSDLIQAPGGIMAGQQCWNVQAGIPAISGSNGTIQLMYSSHYESGGSTAGVYYACADVTFQETVKDEYYSCLNSTDTDSDATTSDGSSSSSGGSRKGLSKGQKVGICVGSIVGGAMVVAAVSIFFAMRKNKRLSMGSLNLKQKKDGWKDLEMESGLPLPKNAAQISR